jgi:hypothetical protein
MSLIDQLTAAFPKANVHSSRDTVRIECGRSWLIFDRSGALHFYRKEGEGTFGKTYPVPAGVDPFTFAANVLAAGRTVEVGPGVNLRQYEDGIRVSSSVNVPWYSLAEREVGMHDFDLNPDYQRGPVWSEHQQRRYLGHCLTGGESPPIYVYRDRNKYDAPQEVVDGQQRLRAIYAFIGGQVPAEVYHKGAWIELWWKDFDEVDRRSRFLDAKVTFGDWSREDRLRFYLRLNSGGVTHPAEELDRVRAMLLRECGQAE